MEVAVEKSKKNLNSILVLLTVVSKPILTHIPIHTVQYITNFYNPRPLITIPKD